MHTATTETYTLSLHDALPICGPAPLRARLYSVERRQHQRAPRRRPSAHDAEERLQGLHDRRNDGDRKSTRLNSSHVSISYAVFCLKKKNISNIWMAY